MKRFAIGLIALVVVGSVGFTSFKIVSFVKSKSDEKIVSEKLEVDKSANANATETSEKDVENSNENTEESTSNSSPNTTSDKDNKSPNSTSSDQSSEVNGDVFNFSSANDFILSYNTLVEDLGTNIIREDALSSISKAMMTYSEVGNLVVEAYQFDGSVHSVIIKNVDKVKTVEGYLNGKAKVKFEDGNTVIFDILTD